MVRDAHYIAVPSFFRCPISLDVMRSPVSLSTGVTYDRSSIQRWLDDGNNTCPATMQVLSSTDLVPNLTLQRLIEIWSRSVRLDSPGSPPLPPPPPPDSPLTPERVLSLARTITSSSCGGSFADSLEKISRFGRESEENCRFLARIDGFAGNLLGLLRNAGDGAGKSFDTLELVVTVTEMVLSRAENRNSLISSGLSSNLDSLKTLSLLNQSGSIASKIASTKIIELFAINAESKLAIAAKEGLLLQLLSLLSPDTSQALIEASLSCLISLSKPKRVKIALVRLQSIRRLSKLLAATKSMVQVVEKSLKLLESVSFCTEGRSALCEDAQCVELILQRLMKVSSEATERAVTILWSLCYLFGDERACEAVSRGNGLARILVVMQSNCSPAVRQMTGDLVKHFGSSLKRSLSGYDTKTTHIMPF
ncbi:U-box domain-containing protein 28-like [Punica granatum]|uniref:U-box domain-containing protein n=2 Tax=Punica granatum TaxID=22663 RepID=A0A218Y2Z6_PUNGR|nr:U-box domain-containing protein 28-like [Punica granatum]OWM91428.1 hypothetical protein CDL15_Pgr017346 [Punica granatum]PKI45238.1 hypothetical protein CRG98_034365 [Punica granatum]